MVFEKTNLMRKSQKLFKIIRKFRPDQNGNQQQAWYLSNLTAVNTLAVGSATLDSTEVTLLDNKPGTNQASSESVTTSIDTSVSGTVGVDQDGANASISGGVSWGTSETYSKANVSINNKSLSETLTGTDASWEYVPAAATPGGQKLACNDFGAARVSGPGS